METDLSSQAPDTAKRVFWTLIVICAVWQIVTYRNDFYLIIDDWAFFGTRLDLLATDGLDDFLLRRHNEHLMAGMVVWDVGIASIFGLRDYLPWLISVLCANTFVAWVIFKYSRRIGVAPIAAAVVSPFFLVWGAFDRVGYWAPEAIFAICLSLLMCHFAIVVAPSPPIRKELVGVGLVILAILIQSICVAVVPISVAILAVRRRWRSMIIACVPLVLYVLWYATYQRRDDAYRWPIGGAYPQDRNLALFAEFGWKSLSRTIWQTANFPTFLVIAALLSIGITKLIRQGGSKRLYALCAVGASFIYLVGFAWARGFATLKIFHQEIPSRYVSVLAILLLPIAGLGLNVLVMKFRERHRVNRPTLAVLVGAMVLLLVVSTAFQKYDRHQEDMDFARSTRDRLTTELADPDLVNRVPSDFVFGDIVWMDIIYSDLFRFRRLGWL